MGDGSPRRRRTALLALVPLAAIGLLYMATRTAPPEGPPASDATAVPLPLPEALTAAPEAAASEPGPEPASASGTETEATPGFDVVRVEPDGSAAVVGTAEPGAKVTIYADQAPLAEAEADADGNFVAIFKVDPSLEPRELTLGAVTPEGAASRSEDVVMLLPRAPAVPASAPEADMPAAEARAGGAVPGAQPGSEPMPVEPAPVVLPAPEVAATVILRNDAVEVTPPPAEVGGVRRVTLGTVSYADGGDVTLAGAGTAGAVVRAYVDDSFAEEARVEPDGRWSMRLGDMAGGVYQLRIDQLAADGKVASRVETPFQRDYPHPPLPRPGAAPGAPGTVSVTVQPGNNLWTLARAHYGSGVSYTQIFTANRDQIRDPDLIYPGQIFNMPENPLGPAAVE